MEFCLPQSFLLSYHKVSGIDVNKLGINDSLNEQLQNRRFRKFI
jgi:hypothetical protein